MVATCYAFVHMSVVPEFWNFFLFFFFSFFLLNSNQDMFSNIFIPLLLLVALKVQSLRAMDHNRIDIECNDVILTKSNKLTGCVNLNGEYVDWFIIHRKNIKEGNYIFLAGDGEDAENMLKEDDLVHLLKLNAVQRNNLDSAAYVYNDQLTTKKIVNHAEESNAHAKGVIFKGRILLTSQPNFVPGKKKTHKTYADFLDKEYTDPPDQHFVCLSGNIQTSGLMESMKRRVAGDRKEIVTKYILPDKNVEITFPQNYYGETICAGTEVPQNSDLGCFSQQNSDRTFFESPGVIQRLEAFKCSTYHSKYTIYPSAKGEDRVCEILDNNTQENRDASVVRFKGAPCTFLENMLDVGCGKELYKCLETARNLKAYVQKNKLRKAVTRTNAPQGCNAIIFLNKNHPF